VLHAFWLASVALQKSLAAAGMACAASDKHGNRRLEANGACSVWLACVNNMHVSQQLLWCTFSSCVWHGCGQGVAGRSCSHLVSVLFGQFWAGIFVQQPIGAGLAMTCCKRQRTVRCTCYQKRSSDSSHGWLQKNDSCLQMDCCCVAYVGQVASMCGHLTFGRPYRNGAGTIAGCWVLLTRGLGGVCIGQAWSVVWGLVAIIVETLCCSAADGLPC
jgi:hypothetical protein